MERCYSIYKKYEEVIMYIVVGALTTIISLFIYYTLTYFVLDANVSFELQIANIISWIISVLFAYIMNRKYVFKIKKKSEYKEFVSFTSSRIVTLLLDMFIMFLFVSVFKYNDKIIKFFSQIIVIVLNYIFSKFFVFNEG